MTVDRLCECKGCLEVDLLTLKFVAHVGEVAFQKVKRHVELAGLDVILVHRMLKNDVPIPEYALVSEPALVGFEDALRSRAQLLEHDFEGLGRTPTHDLDLSHLPPPEDPLQRSLAARWLDRLVLTWKSLPYWLGVKSPCATFRNVEGEIVARALPAAEPAERRQRPRPTGP